MFKKAMLFIVMITACGTASALQEIKVKLIEATYMPSRAMFKLDAGNASCPAGAWLKWENASQENNKAIMSLLMTALVSEKKVTFIINDNDTTCTGRFLYLAGD